MKISVADARALAAALTSGADAADKAGQPYFDLADSLEADYQAAKADLEAAIANAPG
jgi:hypothetical protein